VSLIGLGAWIAFSFYSIYLLSVRASAIVNLTRSCSLPGITLAINNLHGPMPTYVIVGD